MGEGSHWIMVRQADEPVPLISRSSQALEDLKPFAPPRIPARLMRMLGEGPCSLVDTVVIS
jgi:hypothetical protein